MKSFKVAIMCICCLLLTWPVMSEASNNITLDMYELAYKIMQHNKHVFEVKLKSKELEFWTWNDVAEKERMKAGWNRVWAKGKTIVVGTAIANKRDFQLEYIITADPNYIFGKVHAGMSLQDFMRVLSSSETPYTDIVKRADYTCLSEYGLVDDEETKILHPEGIITQMGYFPAGLSVSSRTKAFVKSQMESMGLRDFPE